MMSSGYGMAVMNTVPMAICARKKIHRSVRVTAQKGEDKESGRDVGAGNWIWVFCKGNRCS